MLPFRRGGGGGGGGYLDPRVSSAHTYKGTFRLEPRLVHFPHRTCVITEQEQTSDFFSLGRCGFITTSEKAVEGRADAD